MPTPTTYRSHDERLAQLEGRVRDLDRYVMGLRRLIAETRPRVVFHRDVDPPPATSIYFCVLQPFSLTRDEADSLCRLLRRKGLTEVAEPDELTRDTFRRRYTSPGAIEDRVVVDVMWTDTVTEKVPG